MNKYQEALDILCQNCYLYNEKCECHINAMLKKNNKECQFKNTLQELVDRDKPAKVVDNCVPNCCPNCGTDYYIKNTEYNDKYNFCGNCGQKLDWSGGNE